MATARPAAHRSAGAGGAFSRLAMHTQGAPLILAGRYGGRKHGQRPHHGHQQQHHHHHHYQQQQARVQKAGAAEAQAASRRHTIAAAAPAPARGAEGSAEANVADGRTTSSDSLNTASDESSGPSENSLPRIIKPRKRRKKDRKPLLTVTAPARQQSPAPVAPEAAAPEGSNIVTLKPYVPLCYELYESGLAATRSPANSRRSTTRDSGADHKRRTAWDQERAKQQQRPAQVQVQTQAQLPRKKPLATKSEVKPAGSEAQLEKPEGRDAAGVLLPLASGAPSLCQCRYCDPRGLIWDVHRHCYSPFLTPPDTLQAAAAASQFDKSPFASIPLFLTAPPYGDAADTDEGFFSEDLPTSPYSLFGESEDSSGDGSVCNVLRRSWSGCSSSSQASGSSLGSDSRTRTAPISVVSQALEVSTEIVTSPNGHRDIEIKFYSSSPPVFVGDGQVETKAVNACAGTGTDGRVWGGRRPESEIAARHAVWGGADDEEDAASGDGDSDGECAEKYLGESLWANIQADEQGAKALGDEVHQLSIQAEE